MNRIAWLLAATLAACAPIEPPSQAPSARVTLPVPMTVPRQPPPEPAPPAAPAPAPPPAAETDETQQQVTELLAYYGRVAQMSPEEQRRELNLTTQSFARERSGYNRTRLALLHLLPGTIFQDDARAVQLLEPLTASSSNGALNKFAVLLYAQTSERVKAQKRADQMKDQLEALRAIERSLIDRGQQPQQTQPPRKS